jgi:hypothetical protein
LDPSVPEMHVVTSYLNMYCLAKQLTTEIIKSDTYVVVIIRRRYYYAVATGLMVTCDAHLGTPPLFSSCRALT